MRDFLSALEREAARRAGNIGRLRRDLENLHYGFTGGRGQRPTDYLKSAAARRAYVASILVPNAARALHVLSGAGVGLAAGEKGLDVGAGVGASALALAAISHADSEIVLVDRSGPALDVAAALVAAIFPKGPRVKTVRAELAPGDRGLPAGSFRTVVAGHLLNELLPRRGREPGRALDVARGLASRVAKKGALAILEPAQRVPSRALCRIREVLVAEGMAPAGPCTHAGRCPVLGPGAKDWCVIDVPWRRPALTAEVDRLIGTNRRRLTVSGLVVSRSARPPAGPIHEVLSEPMRAGSAWVTYLCGARGRLAVRLPRRPSPPPPRGSRVTIPDDARPKGRDRSGAPLLHLPHLEGAEP